jgi:hypothetical protein
VISKSRLKVNPPFPLYDNWSLSAALLQPLAVTTILLLLYFFVAVLFNPFVDLPFHDDWTYAWSVEHFLKTGKLQVLDWSIHYPFAQILWGALFCLPFGFSFSALRFSTVVLAWLGALALYGTLREFNRLRSESLIATLVLVANPVFFVLTFSFMTDVPFVSVSNIAFFFIVRGLFRKKSFELWLGCAFGVFAFFIRQIAIAIPGSLLLYVLFTPTFRTKKYLLPPMITSLFICLMPVLIAQTFGLSSQYTGRTWVLYEWLHDYELAIPGLLRIVIYSGLALFPLSLPLMISFSRRPGFWGVVGALFFLTVWSVLFIPETPKPLEGMWRLVTLGKERYLLRGTLNPDFLPSWLNFPLSAFSLLSFAAIVMKAVGVANIAIEEPLPLFVWYAILHFIIIMAVWLFDDWGSDRYSLVLLPPLIMIMANNQSRSKLTLAGIAVLLALSMLITWNETQTSRAVAKGLRWLRQKNIALADIDAGYVFNGWNLYAHPENLPPGAIPERDVPFVTSKDSKPFVIAVSPINGYKVLRQYSWPVPFRSLTYKIYVLEQLPEKLKNGK